MQAMGSGILHASHAYSKEAAMQLTVKNPMLCLQAGQVLTLDDAAGKRIHAAMGTVWVTEEDEREDHIVSMGDSMLVAKDGRTVVQALAPSWVVIQ
jgi:hypothetical protein